MRLNKPNDYSGVVTHEGGRAYPHMTPEQALRRSVLSCLLWEDTFYEDGHSIADRISENALKVPPKVLADLAIEARTKFHLRHVPLLLLRNLLITGKNSSLPSDTFPKVIQRVDEITEFLAIYWKDGKTPIAKQAKIGLAKSFANFDEYQLAKYDRDGAIKIRDVMFLTHPKPRSEDEVALYKKIADQTLATPDTWEVGLSAGGDKKETFERLIREDKLGYLALLRNLRNMQQAKCDMDLVKQAVLARKGAHNVLPFRFISAARACPQMEPTLDKALVANIAASTPLPGKTAVLCDCSGSMTGKLSAKSIVTRMDAAAVLAGCINGDIRLFAFATDVKEVPARKGLAAVDVLQNALVGFGTNIGLAVKYAYEFDEYDRLIVVTDEQSHDDVPMPASKGYMINVGSYKNGVGYGKWVHLDGFSESVLRFIQEYEKEAA